MRSNDPESGSGFAAYKEGLTRKQFLKRGFGTVGFLALYSNGFGSIARHIKLPEYGFGDEISELIKKMTLSEKVSQLQYDAPAIPRLGIPEYNWWNECLHGVARAGLATVFPQAIGLAATWNAPLLHRVTNAISDEARAKHHAFVDRGLRQIYMGLTFWSPNINIVRDPRWGRGQETYGEDPYLTGTMAEAFIKGLQGDDPKYYKVVATAKHFAVYNGPEPMRHKIDVEVSDRDLWETYLPAFEMSVTDAKVASVMCAYNSLRGMPCCGNNPLLESILRDKWDFKGYVVSDCGAIGDFYQKGHHQVVSTPEKAAALALSNGTDLNCGATFPHLVKATKEGIVNEKDIDRSLTRLLEARFRLGMLGKSKDDPYANIPYSVVDSQAHKDLAHQMARESIVLLKNEPAGSSQKPLLPLSKNIGSVAVIGPNANNYWTMLGNYHGTPSSLSTPLDGIKDTVSTQTNIHFSVGCELADGIPQLHPVESEYLIPSHGKGNGLYAEYFDNKDFKGKPSITRVDPSVDFIWLDNTPVSGKMAAEFSVRWTGKIKAPATGTYVMDLLAMRSMNGYKLYVDGKLLKKKGVYGKERGHESVNVPMQAGKTYDVRIEYFNMGPDPQIHFIWHMPGKDLLVEAKDAVRKSDVAVLCMGLNSQIEGEEMKIEVDGFNGGDRTKLILPQTQINLIKEIAGMGKPVVLVLMSGGAVSIGPVREKIPAMLEAWYGGQAGGKALAEVLFGDYNPAGRLPVTFYESVDDLPEFTNYSMNNRTYKYFKGELFYPFGYGLSYTRFTYSDLKVPHSINKGIPMEVTVGVTNAGERDGDEVVQLYVSHPGAKMHNPTRSLQGFRRIHIKAGETQQVTFHLTPKQLAIINEQGNPVQPDGMVRISVGGKQPGFSGRTDAKTTSVIEKEVNVS